MFNISVAQISIWIWSNALYSSRENQINIAQITIFTIIIHKSNQLTRGENRSNRGNIYRNDLRAVA